MSKDSVKSGDGWVFRSKVMLNGELILSSLKVVRLDTVKVLHVGLMVSHIVDLSIKDGRPLVLMHRCSHPRELRYDVLVGTEDFF